VAVQLNAIILWGVPRVVFIMSVPFGVGVGDFIVVATLIINIKSALQDSDGARDDYQELERELDLLELAPAAVKSLTRPPHRPHIASQKLRQSS
jgi:hypothetical protein